MPNAPLQRARLALAGLVAGATDRAQRLDSSNYAAVATPDFPLPGATS
jgi:hypothetical protein